MNDLFSPRGELVQDSDDVLTAEFRHKLGLLPCEEEGLTDIFKSRLGFLEFHDIENQEIHEIYDLKDDFKVNKFNFKQYVDDSFQMKNNKFHNFPLKSPLTKEILDNKIDTMASIAISHAIKYFCKDNSVSQTNSSDESLEEFPNVMSIVIKNLETVLPKFESEKTKIKEENKRQSFIKFLLKFDEQLKTSSSLNSSVENMVSSIPQGDLQLVQFIVYHGILRKQLRDEIYSQLCCQVIDNPSLESTERGWMLHRFCSGCFIPTKKLLMFYLSFLNLTCDIGNYKELIIETKNSLFKTYQFGNRYHPTNSIEFNAIMLNKKILLPVLLADGQVISIQADSSITANEMCTKIADFLNLTDRFGFAIYISALDRVSSLGNGSDHVMDAISECEQVTYTKNFESTKSVLNKDKIVKDKQELKNIVTETQPPWHLFFGKEFFTPWHNAELDQVSTELIYIQIVKSVLSGEFTFNYDDEHARFIARRWYIEKGKNINPKAFYSELDDYIPKTLSQSNKFKKEQWFTLVDIAFGKLGFRSENISKTRVKRKIVDGAQRKWPLQFAALFEAIILEGPILENNNFKDKKINKVVLAINCKGILLLEETYNILTGLHFYDIIEATYTKSIQDKISFVEITTFNNKKWKFESPNVETITKFLQTFLNGLRRRSRWAVAIKEFILEDHSKENRDTFHLKQGDVIELLDENDCGNLKDDWMYGKCLKSSHIGSFPSDCVYIFPTIQKPPSTFLNLFKLMSKSDVFTLAQKRGAVVLANNSIGKTIGKGIQSAI